MSSREDINFQVHYNGRFVTHDIGEVTYDGGEIHFHLSPVEGVLIGIAEALDISLYGQRLWFKFPWEDLNQCKILCDGSDNFQRMVQATMWTKSIELENAHDKIPADVHDDGVEEDMVVDQNQCADDEEEAGQREMCEEEARVESLVANIVDSEDEDDAYQKTPPQSDCEEEDGEECERYIKGSGILKIMQVFEAKQTLIWSSSY